MRRFIGLFFVIILITLPALARAECGDLNCDGVIIASDALRMLRRAVGLDVQVSCVCSTGGVDDCVDTNCDGKTLASDALRVLRRAVGLPMVIDCICRDTTTSTTTTSSSSTTLLPADPCDGVAEVPGSEDPEIVFDLVPRIGDVKGALEGHVRKIAAQDVRDVVIGVYIFIDYDGDGDGRWWVKPNFLRPKTVVREDRTFTCDIATAGLDSSATHVAAFLVSWGTLLDESDFPSRGASLARVCIKRDR